MLCLRLRYWLIFSLYSEAHLSRVGFPCFLELTGKLTGNFLFFWVLEAAVNAVMVINYWVLEVRWAKLTGN